MGFPRNQERETKNWKKRKKGRRRGRERSGNDINHIRIRKRNLPTNSKTQKRLQMQFIAFLPNAQDTAALVTHADYVTPAKQNMRRKSS